MSPRLFWRLWLASLVAAGAAVWLLLPTGGPGEAVPAPVASPLLELPKLPATPDVKALLDAAQGLPFGEADKAANTAAAAEPPLRWWLAGSFGIDGHYRAWLRFENNNEAPRSVGANDVLPDGHVVLAVDRLRLHLGDPQTGYSEWLNINQLGYHQLGP